MFPRKAESQNNQFPLFALTDDMDKKFIISLVSKQNILTPHPHQLYCDCFKIYKEA
jgi:hypothetical protein